MRVRLDLEYRTSWGERLMLRTKRTVHQMTYVPDGMWEVEINAVAGQEYSFEVWNNKEPVRTEWHGHKIPDVSSHRMIIKDSWSDRPQNSPFYSHYFNNVVFRRHKGLGEKVTQPEGNLSFCFSSAEIRSDQTMAITGSGPLFDNWRKIVVMDDTDFPDWNIRLNVTAPFEYKFVVVNTRTHEPELWETGPNRFLGEIPPMDSHMVLNNLRPVFPTRPWRGTGTAVPVFSLRTDDDFGTGEFSDIKRLVDWAVATGQNLIQILPVNDTTMTGCQKDSYPYSTNSAFALHPQYLRLTAAGVRNDKAYRDLKNELNALPEIDYERVNNEKTRLLRKAFPTVWPKTKDSTEYKDFIAANSDWLIPYATFCCLRDENGSAEFSKWGKYARYSAKKVAGYVENHADDINFHCYVQYCLDRQLKDAVSYAHAHRIGLKGDLPIGIGRTSVDAWVYPELFHLDSQAGAPPDAFAANGQNWGFPTYNWEKMAEDGYAWWKARMHKMSEYFDCFRIDHILGFFRIWEIPADCVHGLLGYFNPALPYSTDELGDRGFDMHSGYYQSPVTADWVIERIFGDLANEVRTKYLHDGHLLPEVNTQAKVATLFKGDDEKTIRLREGLMTLMDNVLFIEDPRKKGYYHPCISAHSSYAYEALDEGRKTVFNGLYDEFFYHRHDEFWKETAMKKLPVLLSSTGMLACGEDLGMIPGCVPEVMHSLGVLTLEIQRMPKSIGVEFGDPASYPYYCVCATGTHDTSTVRGWWEEDREASARYYYEILHCDGDVPYYCEPWLCEKIVEQHLKSPAMFCVLPLQDWIAIDGGIRYQGNPADERINVPAIPHYHWRYRMHLSLEQLLSEHELNTRLHSLISESGRNE